METQATTLRSAAQAAISEQLTEAARKGHERNYEKLHVYRDGSLSWFESIDKNSDLIDGEADGFAAIPSLITVGTGSYACNCDYCNMVYSATDEANALADGRKYYAREDMYSTTDEAIADAVANSDLDDLERTMLDALDEIPVGYFDDELAMPAPDWQAGETRSSRLERCIEPLETSGNQPQEK